MERLASVWAPSVAASGDSIREGGGGNADGTRALAAALLAGSPRVMIAGPGLCRADAGGWERRGGEEALARRLLSAARGAAHGSGVGVGVADVAVAADAAARLAASGSARPPASTRPSARDGTAGACLVVPPGETRAFLAPLPPDVLPLSEGFRETLRALGVGRIGWLAEREPAELEARFGEEGLRAARWARGEDRRVFRPVAPEEPPEVRIELEGPVRETEPLLFVLRHLLARLCAELAEGGRCAARLRLGLALEGRAEEATVTVAPARPTRREELLLELCRAGLERAAEGGRLPASATAVSLAAVERAPPDARQGDLFAAEPRDPAAAAGALSRLRARLGEEAVVRPRSRPHHRPEARSGWTPVSLGGGGSSGGSSSRATGSSTPSAVLRLLPEPRRVEVRCGDGGEPVAVREGGERIEVTAAEGPERLSGDGWERPFRREYYRACTGAGELLWLFREPRRGEDAWWLHGWWD